MRVDVSGVGIEYEVTGEGPPVVLLHGFPDSGRLWRHQVPALVDAGFSTIVPDLRGYGASDQPTEVEAYSIPFLAGDVVAILDALGVERAHVVGHDWGAALAWAFGSLLPDRVDHLVALSVGHPSSFVSAGYAQREKSWYMLLFQFEVRGTPCRGGHGDQVGQLCAGAALVFFGIRSAGAAALSPRLARADKAVPGMGRAMRRLARFVTRKWPEPIYELRRELGLPPGANPMFDAKHSPNLVLALFSRVLGVEQKDWPQNTLITGFCFYDADGGNASLPAHLEEFLQARAAAGGVHAGVGGGDGSREVLRALGARGDQGWGTRGAADRQ